MRLAIVHSEIKKAKSSVVDKDAHQRETITKWPIWLALNVYIPGEIYADPRNIFHLLWNFLMVIRYLEIRHT